MVGACFSMVSLYGTFLRRSLTSAGLSSQTINIDGNTTIHFYGPSVATSKPVLVLIHGFGPPGAWQWRQQVSFFVHEFDVYMPDLVFFGESYTKSSERSEIFQAKCIVKLFEKLGISRYSVVGTSYGGFVAYNMAKMCPDRLEKVVIASSAVNMRPKVNEVLLQKANADKIEDVLMPSDARRLRKMLTLVIHRPPFMLDCILNDFIDKLFSENRKEKIELLKGLTIGWTDTINVPPVSQEVLIVWGEHDQIFLLENAKELKELLGQKARLEIIKDTSHTPQLENANQFNKIVNSFLL